MLEGVSLMGVAVRAVAVTAGGAMGALLSIGVSTTAMAVTAGALVAMVRAVASSSVPGAATRCDCGETLSWCR